MASTLIHQDRLRGYFASQLSHFSFSSLEFLRLKIRDHEVATGRELKQSGVLLTQLYTSLFPEQEKTLLSL